MQIPITNTTTKYILTMSPPAVITLNGIDSFVAEYAIWISGMYNFDDTCIYCCDEDGNIYRMELDGEVSPILVRNN